MKNPWRILFFAVALLNLIGSASSNLMLIHVTKPLLMPSLGLWLIMASRHHQGEYSFFRRAVLGALVFSTVGDVLLMYSGELFFLLGLLFFLLAHLFYIGAFSSIKSFKTGFLSEKSAWVLPFLAFPLLLLILLWSGIPAGMRVPVAAYAGVITVMALSVLNLKGQLESGIFTPMMAGAVLFLLSDSLIAVSKFGQPFEGAGFAVILTYIAGQFLLVRGAVGVLDHFDEE